MTDVPRAVTEVWKIWLAGGGLVLVLVWPWVAARWRSIGLWSLVAVAFLNYARWGPDSFATRIDAYDLLHYYVNAKYFDELGYYDLYPCLILADHDNGGPTWEEGEIYLAQHAGGHVINPIEHALARGRHVRDTRFDPETWTAFEHDALYLSVQQWRGGSKLYRQLIRDHGYNGTPAWTLIGAPLTHVVPVEWIKLLGYLDLLLLIGAIAAVRWAWDGDAAGWVALFLLVTYSTRWPTVPWAYLRYDYMALLIAATALLHRARHGWAGTLAGLAASIRMFPVLWLWGPASKAAVELWRGRRRRELGVFFVAFTVAVGATVGGAALRYGPEQIGIHLENMKDHNDPDELSSRRIGLALALTHDGSTEPKLLTPERRRKIADQRGLRLLLAGAVLLAMGWALRARTDAEAFGFGFLPLFLLTTASYYYYVARTTLVVVHAGELDRARNRAGLALLFGIEVFCNWAEGAWPGHRMFLIGWLSWGLCAYTLAMTGWLLWEAAAEED